LVAMYSRREFGKAAMSGLSLAALPVSELWAAQAPNAATWANSNVRGVKLGIISGGLRGGARGGGAAGRGGGGAAGGAGAPGGAAGPGGGQAAAPAPAAPAAPPAPPVDPNVALDQFIEDLKSLGIQHLEYNGGGAVGAPAVVSGGQFGNAPDNPTPEYLASREALRKWRLAATDATFARQREIAAKFKAAGINAFSAVTTIPEDVTEGEVDYIFRHMQALGVSVFCTNQTRVAVGPKLVAAAEKYKISPAWHTHAMVDNPNEVASPDSLRRLLAMSPMFKINLDIGHFTAGNQDAVAFIREQPLRISHLHVKDRRRNNGPSVQWGMGDTPINECLHMIRDNRWPIACIIERDNNDEQGTPLELTKKYMDYMKRVLET
jgi:sugar phosphate isomerase/epimerase